jgi:hypothetical protein
MCHGHVDLQDSIIEREVQDRLRRGKTRDGVRRAIAAEGGFTCATDEDHHRSGALPGLIGGDPRT